MAPASPRRYPPGFVSLERALSKLGVATRREARALIAEGRVSVDGRIERDPLRAVRPETQSLRLDGREAERRARLVIAFHKPRGVVTTTHDPEGRPTVYDYLRDVPARVLAVGRLDWASSGLLLCTNDSRLAAWLTDPANAVPRRYVVTVRGALTEDTAARAARGVVVDGERLSARVRVRKRSGRESHLDVELSEGKNREIRRLLGALGHEVTALKRIAFGDVTLGRLAPGEWRVVSADSLGERPRQRRARVSASSSKDQRPVTKD